MFCTIQLSKADPTPLYIQLANELAKLIKSGVMPTHTKLPTIRTLSTMLHINRDTVVSAYKRLENQGLVIGYVGNGTYVSPQQYNPTTHTTIPCSSLSFPKKNFTTELLHHITQTIINTEGWDAFSDPLNREKHSIREAISVYLKSVAIDASTSHIRLIQQFTSFLPELLKLHPNSCICVEAYHDLTYTSFLRSLGIKLIEIPLTPQGMCLKTLTKVLATQPVSFIWVSTYNQNPTGISYAEETKKELLSLASAHECYIIEDGTYSDFVYNTSTLKPLYSLDYDERVIYLHHFSKIYLPHLQYSFMVLPHHLSLRLLDPKEYTFNERILFYYLQSASFNHLRVGFVLDTHTYSKQILSIFQEHTHAFDIYEPYGGLFLWLKPKRLTMSAITDIFLKNNLVVSPGEMFTYKNKSDYFRLSFSQLTPENIQCVHNSINEISTSS